MLKSFKQARDLLSGSESVIGLDLAPEKGGPRAQAVAFENDGPDADFESAFRCRNWDLWT